MVIGGLQRSKRDFGRAQLGGGDVEVSAKFVIFCTLRWTNHKRCSVCGSGANGRSGAYSPQTRLWRKRTRMLSMDDLFKVRHFDREIIILCVRWYLRFKLSFRDLVEMMAERGISLSHTTIMRWIARYVPEFEKRWNRFACRVGTSWRVNETDVKIKGRWTYLYRAVDKQGKTVDFLLRAKRDVAAAKAFFRRAFKSQGRLPRAITLDGYQASHRAAREILDEHRHGQRTKIRSSKYLNNLIEQDHRSIKLRLGPMLGLKRFRSASITIAGIELMHRIRKGQFKLGTLRIKNKTAPEIWNAVLAAWPDEFGSKRKGVRRRYCSTKYWHS